MGLRGGRGRCGGCGAGALTGRAPYIGALRLSRRGEARTYAESLGKKPSLERLRDVPFVLPVQFSNGQMLPGEDGFALTRGDRTQGHEAATIGLALELAATCNQLTYGPELAARRLLAQGRLVEVKAPGVTNHVDLFLHANSEHVLARLHRDELRLMADVLKGHFGHVSERPPEAD